MTTVTNPTDHDVICSQVEGVDYYLEPGASVDVEPRTALLLGEFGLLIEDLPQALVDNAEQVPTTTGETRFTGGLAPRLDDERANVAGTPVEETGDTGSPTNDRAEELGGADVPGVPAVKAGRGKRRGTNDPSTEPTVETGTQADVALGTGGELSAAAAALDLTTPLDQGTTSWGGTDRATWVKGLKGAQLDDVLGRIGIDPSGQTVTQKQQVLGMFLDGHADVTREQLTGEA